MHSTGNAGGAHNLMVQSSGSGLEQLIKNMGTGLIVTELLGHGVNMVTGDYSRGAAGLWVEAGEIKHAVDVLRKNGCEPKVLHCTSAYPTPSNEANLSAIDSIRKATKCEVGWSDHTVSPGVIHRAIHKWDARIIEFHLDLEGKGEEFNSGHCWLPHNIKEVIKQIRDAEKIDGDGIKEPVHSELSDREWRAEPSDGLRPFKSIRKKFSSN